ncbi:uncharacterized protein LOC132561437 [Ylistrum balloti]|uniref:uncharacterized protein LOC132561437 n=1 Tax=Ylistrum balloti TaxID=509963 RepID=UPI002905CCA0|nr:uncharacterized protein LOC132561437 [Ylistrum balloti]
MGLRSGVVDSGRRERDRDGVDRSGVVDSGRRERDRDGVDRSGVVDSGRRERDRDGVDRSGVVDSGRRERDRDGVDRFGVVDSGRRERDRDGVERSGVVDSGRRERDRWDADGDGYLMMKDLHVLMKKVIDYTGWQETSPAATELYEVHVTFFEVLHEKTGATKDRIELSDWMALWEHMLPGCMGMHNFPIWLRLLPKSLFRVMDTNDDGYLYTEEIRKFYESFVKIPPQEAGDLAEQAFNEMTDFGQYPLTLESYEQIFANFLLGRTKYGPGRHIFGCFKHSAKGYTLISGPPKDDAIIEVTPKIPVRIPHAIRTPMRTFRRE